MKKSIIAMFSGVVLGVVLMLGVFSLLNLRPSNENVLAQNNIQEEDTEKETTEDETMDVFIIEEEIEITESVEESKVAEESETVEEVTEATTEEVAEAETEDATEKKPVINSNISTAKWPYYIKVNRQANCVTIYALDTEGNYTVPIKAMTCSVGTDNRTPLGISKISDKYVWRLLFGDTYGHYSVRFNGHILFHSVPYTSPNNYSLKEGQFNLLGEPASQGCILLCVEDAKWIFDNCAKGTIVEVYDSEDPGPLGKPDMPKIDENSPFKGWDPTDPHPDNPWLHLN